MASLYAPLISNDVLLAQKNLRHRKINFDYEYISSFPHENIDLLKPLTWDRISFNKNEVSQLPINQGIYMFVFNPYSFSRSNHTADSIFYIGQANNLRERINKYFRYPKSAKASDQEKRYMILFFGDYLKLQYYETSDFSQLDLDNLEYSLIDSLLPPFNLKVHSEFAQAYRRLIS